MTRPIVISAGGTGGHVFPALAVARALRDRDVPLVWVGTELGLEARVVREDGFELVSLAILGVRRKGVLRWLLMPGQLIRAVIQAFFILRRVRPALVLGLGGYTAGPTGLAAWLARIPLAIHEQNAIAGLTNRLLAPLATKVLVAFPATFPSNRSPVMVGNPVRREIAAQLPPEQRFDRRGSGLRVLILGGSQGARVFNEVMPTVLAALNSEAVEVWHQSGNPDHVATVSRYAERNLPARVEPFIEEIEQAYAWADVVVCRSGALTVAEIAAVGVASILIPYPHAVDDHQTANARFLADAGAGILVQQSEATQEFLTSLLGELRASRSRLLSMAIKARQLAITNATDRVASLCMEFANA